MPCQWRRPPQANFAGGVFLVVLQPFKVGDFVTAAGVTGTVEEIGLFAPAPDVEILTFNPIGSSARCASVLQQPALLASVLRHERTDP